MGAPDTGKEKIALALQERFADKILYENEELDKIKYALGSMADYRVELNLALQRSLAERTGPTLYTHSVLDNLAYLSFAISRYQLGTVGQDTIQRAVMAWTLTGLILADTFKYGHVFLLQKDFDSDLEYESHELQIILQMILDQYQVNYSIIDVKDDPVEKIAETLEASLQG